MKSGLPPILVIALLLASCVSVPRETVTLSKVLSRDIVALHHSHRQLASLYFDKIKEDINLFVDDVYSPFVIQYVLNVEMERYKKGEVSLFGPANSTDLAEGFTVSGETMNSMFEFHQAAYAQISKMRYELLAPVEEQERQIIEELNKSYEQTLHASQTLTGYLESIHKVKETQGAAFSLAGIQNVDSLFTGRLLKLSELVQSAVKKGKEIDVRSDDALLRIEEVSNQIKNIIQN